MRSFVRVLVPAALLLLTICQQAFAAPTATVPLQVTPERETALAVWEPAQVRSVVLFSTGHGAWPARYDALLQAWREAGFAVLAPLHVDSAQHAERARFSPQQGFAERLSDMRAASGYAAERWPGVPVAAAGHSYGTLIALILGGAMAELAPLRDASVVAVLGYSSPGSIPGLVTPGTYATVAVPVLLVTGDADLVPGLVTDPRDHLLPVERAPPGGKSAVVLAGGDHNLAGGAPEALFARARELGTAFLRAQLLDDADGVRALSAEDGPLERWIRR